MITQFSRNFGLDLIDMYPSIQFTHILGKGTYGTVYRVVIDGYAYAVKAERCPDNCNKDYFIRKKNNEIEIQDKLAKINYSIPVYKDMSLMYMHNSTPVFITVMEPMNKNTDFQFSTILQSDNLHDSVFYVLQAKIIEIINVICQQDVIHADMHMDNIFLRTTRPISSFNDITIENTQVMLIDFGFSIPAKCNHMLELTALIRASHDNYPIQNMERFHSMMHSIVQQFSTQYKKPEYALTLDDITNDEKMDAMYKTLFLNIQRYLQTSA